MDLKRLAPFGFALLGAAIARAVAHFALGDVPHVMDEIAYRLQAETFASGHLTAPLHLPRAAFAMWFVDDRTATFSIFPPGWPAVLALPARLGLREWVNPLLHGVTALFAGAIGRRVGGPRVRLLATAVYALSPQAIILAASLMSHTLVALLAAVATWGALTAQRHPARPWLCGAAVALAILTRPLCAAVIAVAVAAILLRSFVRACTVPATLRGILRSALPVVIPIACGCALLGAYNRALTGDATRFPQTAYFDEHVAPLDDPQFHYHKGCNDLGFGPGHGCDYGIPDATHTPANALSNTGDNARAWFLLAGGGPLVFVAFFAAFVPRRGRARRLVLALPVPAVIAAYALYWYAGTCYGARFYHAGLVGLLVVAACGIAHAWSRWPRVAIAALVLWGAWNVVALAGASRELAGGYWGTDARFAEFAAARRDAKSMDALVMVAFQNPRLPARPTYTWTSFLVDATWRNSVRALSALAVNRPNLEGPVVFAKYHPALVGELRARFPQRELLLYIVQDGAPDTVGPYLGLPPDRKSAADAARDALPPPENFDGFVW